MKHSKVLEHRNNLLQVKGLKSNEVNYAIVENLDRIESSLKPLIKMEKDMETIIKEFTEDRKKLGEKLSTVDGDVKYKKEVNGNGQVVQSFDFTDAKLEEFKKEVSKLRTKHAKKIKEYEEEHAKYLKFIEDGESPYSPLKVKMQHVPSDISTENMKAIFHFIRSKEGND